MKNIHCLASDATDAAMLRSFSESIRSESERLKLRGAEIRVRSQELRLACVEIRKKSQGLVPTSRLVDAPDHAIADVAAPFRPDARAGARTRRRRAQRADDRAIPPA